MLRHKTVSFGERLYFFTQYGMLVLDPQQKSVSFYLGAFRLFPIVAKLRLFVDKPRHVTFLEGADTDSTAFRQ